MASRSVLLMVFSLGLLLLLLVSEAKRTSVGPCLAGRCPRGFNCEENKECYADFSKLEVVGNCVNEECPQGGFRCLDSLCLRPIQRRAKNSTSIGPCVNAHCPDGHICEAKDYSCYPLAGDDEED